MFTNCPECGTVFRISTTELRAAEGYARCGHCSATFNAVATLTDEPPPTVTLKQLELPPDSELQTGDELARSGEQPVLPGFPEEPDGRGTPPELQAPGTYVPLPVSDDTLEFDVPEDGWSYFFDGEEQGRQSRGEPATGPDRRQERRRFDDPEQTESEELPAVGSEEAAAEAVEAGVFPALPDPGDPDNWEELLDEVPDEEHPDPVYVIGEATSAPDELNVAGKAEDTAEQPGLDDTSWRPPDGDFLDAPPFQWPGDEPDARPPPSPPPSQPPARQLERPFDWEPPSALPAESSSRRTGYTAGSAVLALLLIMQLIHLQRDALATNATLGIPLQRTYRSLGMPLFPTWDLRAYQLRNSEAVAGRTSPDALDVLARIAIVGNEAVGLPLVRVTLRDRLAQPLGSRLFMPAEYLGAGEPPREPLRPGTMIPVQISVKDPGADAYGFDVDVCLFNRREGVVCRTETEPFAR